MGRGVLAILLTLLAYVTPASAITTLDWVGNVTPCPEADGWLTVYDDEPLELFVDVYDFGSCPQPGCSGGTRQTGQLSGISARVRLVPVATNLGGEVVAMQYVGDFIVWVPFLVYDGVDRYRATVPVTVLERNSEVYYRITVTDSLQTLYAQNTCGSDGWILKLKILHDRPVSEDRISWSTLKACYR